MLGRGAATGGVYAGIGGPARAGGRCPTLNGRAEDRYWVFRAWRRLLRRGDSRKRRPIFPLGLTLAMTGGRLPMQNLTMRGKALARIAPFSAPVRPSGPQNECPNASPQERLLLGGPAPDVPILSDNDPAAFPDGFEPFDVRGVLPEMIVMDFDSCANGLECTRNRVPTKVSVNEECEGRLTRRRGAARSGPLLRSRRRVDRSHLPDPESTHLPCSVPQCLRWRYQSQPTRAGRRRSADRS